MSSSIREDYEWTNEQLRNPYTCCITIIVSIIPGGLAGAGVAGIFQKTGHEDLYVVMFMVGVILCLFELFFLLYYIVGHCMLPTKSTRNPLSRQIAEAV